MAAQNGHTKALAVLRDGGANLDTPDEVTVYRPSQFISKHFYLILLLYFEIHTCTLLS